MRCLVTGGAGFIGSNLVDALIARGDEVTVVDDLSTGRRVNLEGALEAGAELAELDIRDAAALAALAGERRPEAVFHLAAQIDVRKSLEDPAFDAAINVGGTANVLEAARLAGSNRVVFVSTGGAIYGEGAGQRLPLDEATAIAPLSAYGQSKYAAEGYLSLYERLHGLSTMALRLGNVYGPRQDPLGEAGVIAIFCGLVSSGGRPTIYGDGTQTRDYLFVDDAIDAFVRATERGGGLLMNIGTGAETSVRDLYDALARLTGYSESPHMAPARAGELERCCLDPGRAAIHLGWKPWTALDEGLALTVDWFRTNLT
jgi:UDP-glucose 4-epimerase